MPFAHGPLRIAELTGSPADRGRAHGARFAESIRQYAEERTALVVADSPLDATEALSLVSQSVDAHAEFAPDLMEETEALADAAGISVPQALLVSGYTDFLDVIRAASGSAPEEDNCTAMLIPDSAAPDGAMLAQTWDMHHTATQHVVLLRVVDSARTALVFTTVGCLGQIGMNDAGIAIGINNLASRDGVPAVGWPFLVRKVLQQDDVHEALRLIEEAPLAGAHNYLLMGPDGTGYNVEATPTVRVVTPLADEPLAHTNHCLAPAAIEIEAARDPQLRASSLARIAEGNRLLGLRPLKPETVMGITADETAICMHPEPVYETCGAAIMRPETREFWACWGRPSESDYEHFVVR